MLINKKNSFVKQAAILASASLLVRFIGFLYRLPLTKLIGDEGNGIYSAGYYLYTFFLILSSAGLPAAISKMVSERMARDEFQNADLVFKVSLVFSGVIGFLVFIITFLFAKQFANFIGSPKSFYSILSLSPTIFIVAIASVFRGYFQGMNNTIPTAISQIVEQIFNAVSSVWLAYILIKINIESGAAGGTAGTGIGALAGVITIIIYYIIFSRNKKKVGNKKNKLESNKKILFELINTSVPIIIGTAIFSITNLIDMKMVMTCLAKNFSEQESNILYGQLTGKYVVLTTMPVSLATAVATAVTPNIAGSFVLKNFNIVKQKINIALRITMIISIPAAIGIGVLGPQILSMLFPSHPNGGILLIIGSISIIFLALAQITTGILQGINKLKIPAIAAFCGALIKIPLNYFLISNPKINVIGAVISTTACYIVASFIDLYEVKKATKIKLDIKNILIKPAICSVVMGFACYKIYFLLYKLLNINTVCVLAAILFGILVYCFTLMLLKGFKMEDIKLMPLGEKIISFMKKYNLIID
jgi:stage V sporulation protein B